jgi:hypothetical protein
MADLPPLPPGFKLDDSPASSSGVPPLPAGFTLDEAPPPRAVPTRMQHVSDVLNIAKEHPFTAGVGMLENVLSGATSGVGSLVDAVTGSDPGTHDYAYRPRTDAGKAIANAAGDETAAVGRGFTAVAGDGPLAETIKMYAPEALGAVGTVAGLPEIPKGIASIGRGVKAATTPGVYIPKGTSAQAALDQIANSSKQSMGAAAAAPRVTGASPGLQQAIADSARKTGGAINPEILSRHLEADTLPVPVKLTEGQATQDPALISQEQNMRGKHPELSNHFNAQNDQLIQNMQAIRDQVGPDVFSTNHVEHGDTLMSAYQDIDNAANSRINAAYQQARDLVPDKAASVMDAPGLLSNVTRALHEHDLFDSAPKDVLAALGRRAENGSMSFANIENMKTNLARIQRSPSADGNTRYAAGVIRDQLEQMPLTVNNPEVQAAYNNARALARARFQAMDADPAYKAVVNEKVSPDDFVRKFVLKGNRDDLATMRQSLADNPTAVQTLGVAALDHLRDQAGIPDYRGNFSQAGYNKALRGLDPKLQALVDPRTAEQLQALGNVARHTQFQPRGSFVNNSNTFVAAAADKAAGALEGAANVAAHGIPVGTWGRTALGKIRAAKAVRNSIRPGAGLENLSARDQIADASR